MAGRSNKRELAPKWEVLPKPPKGPINAAIRREVIVRQGFLCGHCLQRRRLELHHESPRGNGGGYRVDSGSNLVALCHECHKEAEREPKRSKFGNREWRK